MSESHPDAVEGPVLVIGTGLIGTSVALSLRRAEVEVLLSDVSEQNLQAAIDLGAGRRLADGDSPSIVVVAVPPRHAAEVIAQASTQYAGATITDVTSVKTGVITGALARGADEGRLVGGHPMAGREVSGAAGARKELLDDRLWVITPLPANAPEHVERVHRLVETCGAVPSTMGLREHDDAVALVSHTPQVLSSVLAGQLTDSDEEYVRIAGQGLRDMTRIAASNVPLWSDILAANAGPVADVLDGVIAELERAREGLRELAAGDAGGDALVREVLQGGVAGQALIPGKHGERHAEFREITVQIADKPGELGRLFSAVSVAQVNLEDIRIEHVMRRPSGLVALYVQPEAGDRLVEALQALAFDVRA